MVKCRHYSLRVKIDVRKTMVVLVIAEFFCNIRQDLGC